MRKGEGNITIYEKGKKTPVELANKEGEWGMNEIWSDGQA